MHAVQAFVGLCRVVRQFDRVIAFCSERLSYKVQSMASGAVSITDGATYWSPSTTAMHEKTSDVWELIKRAFAEHLVRRISLAGE